MEEEPRKISVYKIEVLAFGFNGVNEDEIIHGLENIRDIFSEVIKVEKRVVDWTDDHPLNKLDTKERAYKELFNE